MNPKHEKELWQIRFQKILALEKDSFDFYGNLLEEKSALLKEAGLDSTIQQIRRDEGKHIRIAAELLRLVLG